MRTSERQPRLRNATFPRALPFLTCRRNHLQQIWRAVCHTTSYSAPIGKRRKLVSLITKSKSAALSVQPEQRRPLILSFCIFARSLTLPFPVFSFSRFRAFHSLYRFTRESIEKPFLHPACTQLFVSRLCFCVPIQAGPFHSPAISLLGQLNAVSQKGASNPAAAKLRQNKNILEIKRRASQKRGISLKDQSIGDRLVVPKPKPAFK